jgi:hypothetical protein
MNEGLGIFFDQFGNPLIGDMGRTPPTFPEGDTLPSPQDIAISEGARILTDTINSGVGVDVVNQGEGEQFIREGILAGNPGVVQDIVANKINNLDDSAKGAIASQAFGVFNPALAQLAAANQVNQGIQVAGDFVQSGIGTLQDRMDPEGFGFGALDRTSNIIEGVQNISGDVVGSANRIVGDLIINPLGQVVGRINRGVISPLFSPIQDFGLNLIGRGDDRRDDEQGPGIVINQAQDSKPDVDPESITQTFGGTTGGTGGGGGADASRSDFTPGNVVIGSTTGTTSGPAGRGFTPVQRETQRISDIMDRRRRGSSQGFNAGGLASIPKYLKGR